MQVREIPLRLITLPNELHRISMDPAALKSLADNIEAVGLLNPITVEVEGDHFVLRAGHRRLEAHRLLRRESIWANVRDADATAHGEILTWAENFDRSDLSPIEQARACDRAMKKGGFSPAQLARQIKRSVDWVEDRIALLSTPSTLQDLVHAGELPMRHAHELARVTDDQHREHLTRYALLSGASYSVIKDWVAQWRLHSENPAYTPLNLPPLPLDGQRAVVMIPCWTCTTPKQPHEMRVQHICIECARAVLEATAEWREAAAPPPAARVAQDPPA